MSDALTDTERTALNEQVARAMGWHIKQPESGETYWTLPDGGIDDAPPYGTNYEGKRYGDFYALPDFCGDVMAIGYLVGWLATKELSWELHNNIIYDPRNWAVLRDRSSHEVVAISPAAATPGEAMCRAIEAWDKAQKEAGDDN